MSKQIPEDTPAPAATTMSFGLSQILPVLVNIFEGSTAVLDQFPDQSIVVTFWAPWSHVCPAHNHTFYESAALYPGVPHVFVNVDVHRDLAVIYDVLSVPTILVLKDREVTERLVGEVSPSVLDALVALVATGS